jgi:urea ABC transporter permease protein UrtC
MRRTFSPLEFGSLAVAALVLIVGIPALNAAGLISDFSINLWGKYLCYAVLAISVDMLWGYTGLLSLGQALFFSLGGYMLGMHLMLMIGKLGQYKSDLPDFMVFLGYRFLPTFWRPFYSFGFAAVAAVAVPGVLALAFGYLAFRSRIKGVYFSILTQALTYAGALMFFRNDLIMGGNNGFTDFKFLLGHDLHTPATKRGLFIATAILVVSVYAGCRWLTLTKFGLVQRAVRDSETRVLFSGYAASNYKLFVFVLSAVIAGLGGALYVPQVGIINPGEMTTAKSLEAVVWCAVGGRGTLIGPIIGAVGINALYSWATRAYPDLWPIMLGSLFIVVVLFLPQGVVGIPKLIKDAVQRRRSPLDDATRPSPGALAQPPVTPAPDGVPSAVSSPTSEP